MLVHRGSGLWYNIVVIHLLWGFRTKDGLPAIALYSFFKRFNVKETDGMRYEGVGGEKGFPNVF